jgi:hypothetical protein
MMTFTEYQRAAEVIPVSLRNSRDRVDFPVRGLQQDAGRLGTLLASAFDSGKFKLTPEQTEKVKDSLADLLWYIARLSEETGISMEEIATHSVKQLQLRMKDFDPEKR